LAAAVDIFLCRHIHTVNCSLLTRDYRFRGKVRQNLLKMQIIYREIPQNHLRLLLITFSPTRIFSSYKPTSLPPIYGMEQAVNTTGVYRQHDR
ncbi:hypothetical protein, partial [Prevotella denticola]|uniref:hypothetical protein n=1 Tax=Prevotella denticola TaxID=28129 RepID=UPI003C778DF7